jgi:N6-L-threonylcarbamoyladenine synthase
MLVLGIETACDDSAASVVRDGVEVLSNVVWSQKDVHEHFGGVVPELAARRHADVITRVLDASLREARVVLDDVDAFAVNNQHGLLRSVLVGVTAAKSLALATGKPFIGLHHIEGHIYSALLTDPSLTFPHVCLAVAGGHNLLILVNGVGDYEIVGRSLDDAAGEAFDKVAKELHLGFPGGPLVDRLAPQGDPARFELPRPMLDRPGFDFSFSGLKTAVRFLIARLGPAVQGSEADIAASFQAAVIDILLHKTLAAARAFGVDTVTVVGGVAANSGLRRRLADAATPWGIRAVFAHREYCTDNAAMIAGLGFHYLANGERSEFSLEAYPNHPLGKNRCEY